MDKLAFKNYITQKVPLTDSEWQLIDGLFKPKQLKGSELLLKEGAVCNHLYYVGTGLLRFFVWKDGTDRTKFFTFDNYLFTSQRSFSTREPATENIQAVADCSLLQITHADLQTLYEKVPNWRKFIQAVIQEVSHFTEEILTELQTETAESRYRKMLTAEPEMIQRIPLKYLASYLGIAPQSLSRIRKNVRKGSRNEHT
ncbi:MAG: Crp/Fnr family transcriptional regulator [Ferruginibacter sp.]|nr:Crp/Fnr family transcriptional regulator [Cytophagales bacterium]